MKEVLFYLKNLIKKDDTIVVATSGGPDSMCLLHLLCELNRELNFKIVVAHINHNLRKESLEEAEYVKKFAEENKLIFEYREIKEYNNNVESDAREKRYIYFKEIVNKYQAKYLMTAHHGDDLMETILMRLTRGSSLKGYSGFKKVTKVDNFMIIRPLITLTKKEITDYMDTNNFKYFVDKSNFSRKYTRNRYRLDALPFFKKENKDVHLHFLKFSEELANVSDFLERYLKELHYSLKTHNGYLINELLKLDDFILKKFIQYELSLIYIDNLYLVDDRHIFNIIKLIKSGKSNLNINLPNKILAIKEYNYFKFDYNKERYKEFDFILKDEVSIDNSKIKVIEKSNLNSNNIIRLNSKDIKLPIHIRNRHDGDKIIIKNLGGSKKVKDVLIDVKMPKELRNNFPIVTDSEDVILWLPGVKKSKFDVETNGIYDIILSYEEE